MTSYTAAESEVYEFVKQLAVQQEQKHSNHASAVASHVAACSSPEVDDEKDTSQASHPQEPQKRILSPLRISTFKGGSRPSLAAGKGDPQWACAVERGH